MTDTEPWEVYVCSCGRLVQETYEFLHTGEGHDGGRRVEVVRASDLDVAVEALKKIADYADLAPMEDVAGAGQDARAALEALGR